MHTKSAAVIELANEFPNISTHALARMVYEKHKALFKDVEAARKQVRYLRSASGAKDRDWIGPRLPKTTFTYQDPFKEFADGKESVPNWGPLVVAGPATVLVIGDVHIPYHNKPALEAAIKYGLQAKCNTGLLNGDIADFFSLSRFEKDPRNRNFAQERNTVQNFLQILRQSFPKARIIFKEGNHEYRLTSYMRAKAPELLGIEVLELDSLLGLSKHNIEVVLHKRPIELGDLTVLHGHEFPQTISKPVNVARGLFLRAKSHALCGHAHQVSMHTEKAITGKSIACWSHGCLCELYPEYMPINNWEHGFAVVRVEASGKFTVDNRTIKNGAVL